MPRQKSSLEFGGEISLDMKNATKAFENFIKIGTMHYGKAVKAAFTTRELKALGAIIEQGQNESNKRQLRLNELLKKDQAKTISDREKTEIQYITTIMKKEEEAAKQRFADQEDLINRRIAAAKKYKEITGEDLDREIFSAKKADDLGNNIADAFSAATSKDLKAWGGLIKKLGGFTARQGARLESKEGAGAVANGLGSALGGLAKGLMVIAGVVGGLMAIAKVLLDADAAAKELNRTLLEGGIAGADLSDKFGMVSESIDKVRKSFTEAFKYNMRWGVTAKDTLAILGQFAEAGLTYKEITAGAKSATEETRKLQDATEGAIAYSKVLGMTSSEVAQNMATYMEEFGLTLRGVEERFSAITLVAKESGFATKRFFNMVLQATSGMSMYNVRLEEAAELLIQLGKVLGQKMGGDYLQSLTKGFQDESTQDRVKKTMTTGLEKSLGILQKDAVNATKELQRRLESLGAESADKEKQFWGAIGTALKKTGDEAKAMSPESLARALSELPSETRAAMIAAAGAANDELARMLAATQGKSLAFKGTRGGAQAAREFAGPGAALLLQLNELQAVLGKRVDQIDMTNVEERMSWENLTGKQGDRARQEFEVGQRLAGMNQILAESQERIKKMTPAEAAVAAEEFNRTYAKNFGVMLNAAGERFKAVTDAMSVGGLREGAAMDDTFEGLVLTMGNTLAGKLEVAEDLALARDVVDNTRDLTHIMESGVQVILEKIYGVVASIKSLLSFGGDLNEEERSTILSLQGDLGDEITKLMEQKAAGRKTGSEARTKLNKGGLSPEEQSRLEAVVAASEANDQLLAEKIAGKRTDIRLLSGLKEGTFGSDKQGALRTARESELALGADPEKELKLKEAREAVSLAKGKHVRAQILGKVRARQVGIEAAEAEIEALRKTVAEKEEAVNKVLGDNNEKLITVEETEAKLERAKQDEIYKKQKDDREKELTDELATRLLTGAGVKRDEALEAAKVIRGGGTYAFSPDTRDKAMGVLGKNPNLLGGNLNAYQSLTGADDMVLQIGNNGVKFAQRVDPGDVGVFAKSGGALSQAGGKSGGSVNIFHMYNDGPGILKTIEKAQKAGVLA